MFDISKDQLRNLTAAQLRELVARLCEAELGLKGLPASAVRWGGSETAADGGLDVDCRVSATGYAGDFVPRTRTGFQVKKSTMPASRIASEMAPEGNLRPIFSQFAAQAGCYVIVSLGDDASGAAAERRITAMREQLAPLQDRGSISLQFYGRAELANWLRQHPGVQLWARGVLGLPVEGWSHYGRWAKTPPNVSDDLISEKGVSIHLPNTEVGGLELIPGIEEIRRLIESSEKSVRIVGLSGVGKTRIVQSLFEEDVGTGALSKHLALYADIGELPRLSARDVVSRLAAEQRDAILVLDNCPAAMHEDVASMVAETARIRLVSIEYDIRDNKHESTNVVRIEAEGPDIAEALVLRRYRALGQVNSRRIAEFSGGNSRLAVLLAEAASVEGGLSDFSNERLFERLFYQRHTRASKLLEAAEVLALLYSFSIARDEQGVDELGVLSRVLGQERKKLYRATQILLERQLAQKRGRWRAVLPHALANWLAERALRYIDTDEILGALEDLPNSRLLHSFGKRLGYLHNNEMAREIVEAWLAPDGVLHDIGNLDHNGIQLLRSVAPVAPENVLRALEGHAHGKSPGEFFATISPRQVEIADLLVLIAYEADLFERCVRVLAKLSMGDGPLGKHAEDRMTGLFSLHLSGTEASPDLRERVMRCFLQSAKREQRRLGVSMLGAALNSRRWFSVGSFEFGAHARTNGYFPRTVAERDRWFRRFLTRLDETDAQANVQLSEELRKLLAEELPGMWEYSGLRSPVSMVVKTLHARRPWIEGWRAVRRTKSIYFRPKEQISETSAALEAINELDDHLRPTNIVDQVRAHVLARGAAIFSWDDEDFNHVPGSEQKSYERGASKARSLGEKAAADLQTLNELSQELFSSQATYALEFGRGLAERTPDLQALLICLAEWLEQAGDEACQCLVLVGALQTLHERSERAAHQFIDGAIERPALRRFALNLHLSVPFSPKGFGRLLRITDIADVPTQYFSGLAWQPVADGITEENIGKLMRKLLKREDGAEVVLENMSMRLECMKQEEMSFGKELGRVSLVASAQLLRRGEYPSHGPMTDHYLSSVLREFVGKEEDAEETDGVFEALSVGLKRSRGYAGGLDSTFEAIAETATGRFLDCVFSDAGLEETEQLVVFSEQQDRNPLSGVDPLQLLAWCEHGDRDERITMLAEVICPFGKESENGAVELTDQARLLLDKASDPSTFLKALASSVRPGAWVGNLSMTIEKRRKALEILLEHDRVDIRRAVRTVTEELRRYEVELRRRERDRDEQRGQQFE